MAKVLLAYATRGGSTRAIAEGIAEGVRFEGMEAETKNISEIKTEADLNGYDGYIFGAPTYHGEMVATMKTFLFLAEKADLKSKAGGAFGAFGWSGEAPDRIYQTMKNIFQMNLVSGALRLKAISLGGGTQMAQDYGRQVAKKVMGPA